MATFRLGKTVWRLDWLPFGGKVEPGYRRRQFFRLRQFLMVAAGPAVTFGLVLIAVHFVYGSGRLTEKLRLPTQAATEILGWFIVWPEIATLVGTLWPHKYRMYGAVLQSDGLQMLRAPFLTRSEID